LNANRAYLQRGPGRAGKDLSTKLPRSTVTRPQLCEARAWIPILPPEALSRGLCGISRWTGQRDLCTLVQQAANSSSTPLCGTGGKCSRNGRVYAREAIGHCTNETEPANKRNQKRTKQQVNHRQNMNASDSLLEVNNSEERHSGERIYQFALENVLCDVTTVHFGPGRVVGGFLGH